MTTWQRRHATKKGIKMFYAENEFDYEDNARVDYLTEAYAGTFDTAANLHEEDLCYHAERYNLDWGGLYCIVNEN